MYKILRIQSNELLDELSSSLWNWSFRGQIDASWPLQSSLERSLINKPTLVGAVHLENTILRQFQRRAHHYLTNLPSDDKKLEWLALLQHHGAPTRLIDLTHSFNIGLYFSIERACSDSALWAFNINILKDKLSVFKRKKTETTHHDLSCYNLNLCEEFLSNKRKPKRFVIPVEPEKMNERLSIQQGFFLFPCHIDSTIEYNISSTYGFPLDLFEKADVDNYDPKKHTTPVLQTLSIIKIVLPKHLHEYLRNRLWKSNISSATLFPGLDGFARSLYYYIPE